MNNFLKITFILFFLAGFLFQGLNCKTYIPIPIASSMPDNFMKIMRGGKKIGIVYNIKSLDSNESWSDTIQSSAENKIQEFRYFTIVDISKREARLKQIIYSQSGLTSNVMEFGNELAIDGLVYLNIPKVPKTSCVTTSRIERRRGDCLQYKNYGTKKSCDEYKEQKCIKFTEEPIVKCIRWDYYSVTIYESYRTSTVFLKGELMNVQTGAKLSYMNTMPFSDMTVGKACTPELLSYHKAIEIATTNIIKNISPKISDYYVPLESSPKGSPPKKKKIVKSYLKMGNEYVKMEPRDFEEANSYWKKALVESAHNSSSAYWNLALYSWYSGNVNQADQYFKKASDLGGVKFLKKNRKFISLFKSEQKRINIEEKAIN